MGIIDLSEYVEKLYSCIWKGSVPEKLNKADECDKIIIPINTNGNHCALQYIVDVIDRTIKTIQ